ncbi:efflux RND transporter periplasmic adaptor subunit [Blastopirellula marina]|uniref:efflux RND transporter periplasmic adaptor subunit n=1 Tax=Blastopirellula marina TaxID=124 RepID=UPI001304D8E9|nr:efflux RND transporter periplasmic adaptor subunit [Blastopirellula marina]
MSFLTAIRRYSSLAIAAGIFLVGGCRPANQYQEPPPSKVTVAKPLVRDVTVYMEETGTTEAVQRADVYARVSGVLQKIVFQPNDEVTEGDILFNIQPDEYVAKRDLASADLELARVAEAKAKNDLERQRQVFEKGAVSEMKMVELQAEVDGSAAQINAAQAKLDQAVIDVGYTTVKAPISGRVGKSYVKEGNLVSSLPATELTTIISNDAVYANFSISERAYLRFVDSYNPDQKGKRDVKLFLARATDTDFPYEGSVNFTDLTVERGTGTFAIRGLFQNTDGRLTPGLFVRIRFPVEVNKDAMLAPERATAVDQAGSYVLIVNDENVVERRDVVVGAKFGAMVVIAPEPHAEEALTADDRIILDGVQFSRPGAVVDPQPSELSIDESLLNPNKPAEPSSPASEAENAETDQ